ncbi:ATP-binding cassette domain-containing protein [Stackebrandtia endophytica]|nr:ABC transporter ATP-binding protein [Stackebrandtia endophytica]
MTEPTDGLAIETTGLTKRFAGKKTAVDDVTLDVRRGEVYGFVGLNGAGKTTFMRMLVGLARPTSGTLKVLGSSRLTNEVLRRVGTTIEKPAFYPGMTGRQNLTLLARYTGMGVADIDASLKTVDLAGRADDKFRTYSLGMKQRLALAAALMGDAELLILDEPTNGLDPSGMAAMRDLIREQAASGRTVMLSSHLLGEIAQVCDRVGVIHHGRLIAVGTTGEIESKYGARPSLVVTCDEIPRAAVIAAELDTVEEVREQADGLLVFAPEDAAGPLTSALVAAGVTVRGIRPNQRSLEDVFLEMTSDTVAERQA